MRYQYLLYFGLSAAFLAAGFFFRGRYSQTYPEQLTGTIQENLSDLYANIEKEAVSLIQDSVTVQSRKWDNAVYSFIETDSSSIVAWSNSDYIPDVASLRAPGEFLYLTNQRGDYILRRWTKGSGYLINILSLRQRYPIANGFLIPSVNEEIFPVEVELVAPTGSTGESIRFKDKDLFRVSAGTMETRDSQLSFMLLMTGLVLFAWGVNEVRKKLQSVWGFDLTLILLLASLYGVRLLMVSTGIPALYLASSIFDPRIFASSTLNATMGDLFLNSLCILLIVLYLFRHYTSLHLTRWMLQQGLFIRSLAAVIFLFFALLAVLLSFNFIEVIYHNSTETLDVSQSVSVTWVRIIAFLSVMMGTVSAFLFIHVMASLGRHLVREGWIRFLAVTLIAVGLFFLQIYLTGNDNWISLWIGLFMLLGLRLFKFDHLELTFSFPVFLYLVFSLTLFSIHHSLAVRDFNGERLVRDQFRYAKDFLTERDVLGEYLLDQTSQRIARDPFIQTRMGSPFFSKASVVDKVRKVHLNRYFDRYELSITTRGPVDSLFQPSATWNPTGYEGVYFTGTIAGEALRRYHVTIPVFYQRPVGTVELDLVLKRLLPDNVFPELLVDNRFSQLYRNRDFSYAVYLNGQVLNSSGSFHYERNFNKQLLESEELFRTGISSAGYTHVGIEESDGSIAVVSARAYTWSSLVTNVSFWFVLGLVILFTAQGIFGLAAWFSGRQFGYTARIQVFMFLSFALPMIAVSITTLTLITRSNAENTAREYVDRSTSAAVRLAAVLAQDNLQEAGRLEGWVAENVPYVETDISVYSPAGKLLSTSQPSLFENQLVSNLMNREAYWSLVLDGQRQFVGNERIGSLEYKSAYAAVLSPQTGKLLAIVSLPFFESASYLQRGQARVLSNILQVFVIVFLVFTLVSFLAANNLAAPIRFMARTLRQTTLSGENKPLAWPTKDEMGLLVQEYNRMVGNLDESKRALAQSEKESAWREMAKQVAHEIKNPLTPMKLTLQQLENDSNPGTEKTRKSVEVMLKQVEILDAIASSFSSVARMPALAPQRTDLVTLITQASALFENAKEGKVQFVPSQNSFWVSVDPTALSRVLSNVVINALQARVEDRQALVEINVSGNGKHAIISVRDNGRGIPESLQGQIFQPQFTTKESGSGLGLYMARQFVLQSGGRIWFTTTKEGTTFFIELPLSEG